MPRKLLLLVGIIFVHFSAECFPTNATPSYQLMGNGVIVFPDPNYTFQTEAVKVEVLADHIIHVSASPEKKIQHIESLSVIERNFNISSFSIDSTAEKIIIKTSQLSVEVLLKTGAVSFFDKNGKSVLVEKGVSGRRFVPITVEGQRSWQINQDFYTSPDDAYYGLGQHQEDVFNYRQNQVQLFQNNTQVAVPFVVSAKNYGILWDNYSLTTVGDVRPYHPLSSLQLYSKGGEQGWLSATYYNDRSDNARPVLEKAESSIRYEYLNESKMLLPQLFDPGKGKVVWEGSMVSDFEGLHKIKMLHGGYIKVWIDGNLIADRWRRAWNPAPALLPIHLEKGKNYPIKIEWIPESDEAYLSFKWIEPITENSPEEIFSFSSEAGRQLNYYFIYGSNMDEVIAGYRAITGKAPIVPKWALGFWQSRERYKTEEELMNTVKEFRERKIPIDNIVLDWSYWKENEWGSQEFDQERFPDPEGMIKTLHEKYNTQFMISVWPKFYEGIPAYKKFDNNGWLYKRNIADRQRDWIGEGYVSTFYDAFDEKARKGFWDLIHEKIYTKGIDAWWMDASEPDILSNVSPEKRKQQMTPTAAGLAAEFLNAYPLQNAKGIYEGQRSVDNDKRVFLLTRSGFAGSQRYAATIWSGDIGATWHDMKAQISAGINFSMSGLPYWTMDVGGFVVEDRFVQPDKNDLEEWRELLTRWHQFGAFVPIFRSHGQYPFREIYNTAPDSHVAYKSMVYYNKLRYRLMPYIYSLAGKAYHDDYTIMRGLPMDFANDKKVLNMGDQYMFGPSLLISPVYQYQQREKEVYLPGNDGWYDLYSGKYYKGKQTIKVNTPYERMPVFVREGSIITVGPDLQYTNEKPADTITVYVYTGKNASFELYEDEGINYNYEKGNFATIPFIYNESERKITIGNRKGEFNGMLAQRVFVVVPINKNGNNISIDQKRKGGSTILYNGKAKTIKLK